MEEENQPQESPGATTQTKSPYTCLICGKTSKSQVALTQHVYSCHTKEGDLLCPHCDYKTKLKYNMIIHIRTHTGEKPFQCPHCLKRFSVKGYALSSHRHGLVSHRCSGGYSRTASHGCMY
ncbi:hypothetical protein KIPB_010858 [Kipferlia bialata]|uniref:C2H2-type domain-containing protein n=1 Tax=Kipferlia bialata TaxID=797122 RepID=A0A9K3D4R2_9EUKA|nr:hypothetical protein KIPB_010858 [Kipferlia bialata]|eukprot:g10858.t1